MSKPIDLAALTADQKAQLLQSLQAEETAAKNAVANNRKAYKALVEETIPKIFYELKLASAALVVAKTSCYNNIATLLQMKIDAYGADAEQLSHTFTTSNGTSLIIGNRTTDGWDDTVNIGIAKVNNCLSSFVKDDNSRALVNSISRLLQKDTKGNLKATRVFQLRKLAEESRNAELIEAIDIIEKAHQPNMSKKFITLKYKGTDGEGIDLPLSITDAEIDNSGFMLAHVAGNVITVTKKLMETLFKSNLK